MTSPSEKGNTYFVFDRGETAKISECCRLSFKLDQTDLDDAKQPWKMRYCALQNVTLNLPRIAYLAKGDDTRLFSRIADFWRWRSRPIWRRKLFIEKLLSLGEKGPLALLAMDRDGSPYLRMHRASFLIGMVGLNELVQIHTGQEMHQSREAFKFGLKVIAHMKLLIDKFSQRYGMRFVLEQTPAESTAYRFAKLDLTSHSPASGHIVKGDISRGEVYYTNSTYLNNAAVLNPIERVRQEGLFHPLIEAGALTHHLAGRSQTFESSLANFVIKTFQSDSK